MQLTQHTDFGLRMLMYLALQRPGTASVGEVAHAFGISSHHLMKVAQDLRHQGIVVSHRGRSGGLELAREPQDVTVGEVVRSLEKLAVVECLTGEKNRCVLTPACALRGALEEAVEAFLAALDKYTLADLLERPERMRKLVGLG